MCDGEGGSGPEGANDLCLPGDQPEWSKCMMLLLLEYKRKLVGDGLELKRIAERLLI